jgi:hypothetical protein
MLQHRGCCSTLTESLVGSAPVYVEPCPRIATVAGLNNFGRLYPEAIIFTTAAL